MAPQLLTFETEGAQLHSKAAASLLPVLASVLDGLPSDRPGFRLHGSAALSEVLGPDSPVGRIATGVIGSGAKPVRALFLDKNEAANWSLGWHQDRTIAVRERVEVPGFRPWTVKQGILHVQPPFEIIAAMATLRVHLDAVPGDNGPLLIALGSHRFGRIAESEIEDVVSRCETMACEAEAGDVWLYATPILHASDAAKSPNRRRVLQVDYAAIDLPDGLEWLGI